MGIVHLPAWRLRGQVPDRVALRQGIAGSRARVNLVKGSPVRVLLVADDRLRYEEAARLIGACASAGVDAIRLADPGVRRAPTGRGTL